MLVKQKNIKRKLIIGDEWLYYKLYTGPKSADYVLTELVKPVSEYLLSNEIIDKWFFIRFGDPDLHIRLRFHLTEKDSIISIIRIVNKEVRDLIDENIIWSLQVDTYQREIERYGMNTMEISEDIFFHDSVMVVNMLDMIEGEEGERIRWLFGLRAIDSLLDDFDFSLENKSDLLKKLKDSFADEFGMNKDLRVQLDKKFRNERPSIQDVLDRNKDAYSEMFPLFKLLDKKSKLTRDFLGGITKLRESNELRLPLNSLVSSYIHMMLNRLFKSKQRVHEMVLYDFLYKYYKSALARIKYSK